MSDDWRARWVAMQQARASGRSVKDIAAEYKIGPARVRQLLKKKTWSDNPRPARTHCKHGHLLTEDNVYRCASQPGTRYCRQCINRHREKRMNITVPV